MNEFISSYILPLAIALAAVPAFVWVCKKAIDFLEALAAKTAVEWDDKLVGYVDRLAETAVIYVEQFAENQKRELQQTLSSKEKFDMAVNRIYSLVEKYGVPRTLVEHAVEAAHAALLGIFSKLPEAPENSSDGQH